MEYMSAECLVKLKLYFRGETEYESGIVITYQNIYALNKYMINFR